MTLFTVALTPYAMSLTHLYGGAMVPMVSLLTSRLSSLSSSPGPEHCIVFLSETLYSHSASLHPGVKFIEYQQIYC